MSFARIVSLVVIVLVAASPAAAQATRTWVSGVGDDNNSCSRTAPCKTFAAALLRTAKDGEINCLDGGGFGSLTIAKSITIDCSDSFGGILVPASGTGVVVNISDAADTRKLVRLRGLRISGVATASQGVRVLAANTVIIDDTTIAGFTGNGLEVNVAANTVVHVNDSSIDATGVGVRVLTNGAATAVVTLDKVQLVRNTTGVQSGAGTFSVSLLSSLVSNSTTAIDAASGTGTIYLDRTTLLNNATGLDGASGTTIRIGRSVIANNGTSMVFNGSNINSDGTNSIRGNTTNTAPNGNPEPPQ
jgi:hypothetical protein